MSNFDTSLRGTKQSHNQKNLLLVFVKNPILGKVKTRLAKVIGDEKALAIYQKLTDITFSAITTLKVEKRIYFSDVTINEKTKKTTKFVQKGANLGEKMQNAFETGFAASFDKIILIGSDLPDISAKIIAQGFNELIKKEVVFGPAEDGGYYLVGMTKKHFCIFQNKQWSTENLLKTTCSELKANNIDFSLLQTLNDIDTIEDLEKSSIYRYLSLKP